MPFPKTLDELREAGYEFENEGTCKGCGADIEWWKTPAGKNMPMDHGTATSHWSTCPKREQFKSTSRPDFTPADWEFMRKNAQNCFCTVCKKLTGR